MDLQRKNDGTWIQMYTGGAFYPCDPLPRDVNIFDIAHSLALSCRWTGHIRKHYSVAQHSVLASRIVPQTGTLPLQALLHDASEAYISDIARPTKRLMPEYQGIEKRIMDAILAAFRLPLELAEEVKIVDDQLLFTEARDLVSRPPMPWKYVPKAGMLKQKIRPWPIWYTEIAFLWRFGQLTGRRWDMVKGYVKQKWSDFTYFTLGLGDHSEWEAA